MSLYIFVDSQLCPFAKRKKRYACIYIQLHILYMYIYTYIYVCVSNSHANWYLCDPKDIWKSRDCRPHRIIGLPAGRRFPWCAEHSWWSHLDLRSNSWVYHSETQWLQSERATTWNGSVALNVRCIIVGVYHLGWFRTALCGWYLGMITMASMALWIWHSSLPNSGACSAHTHGQPHPISAARARLFDVQRLETHVADHRDRLASFGNHHGVTIGSLLTHHPMKKPWFCQKPLPMTFQKWWYTSILHPKLELIIGCSAVVTCGMLWTSSPCKVYCWD